MALADSQFLIRTYPGQPLPEVAREKVRLRRRERLAGEVPFERGAGQRMFLKGLQKETGRK